MTHIELDRVSKTFGERIVIDDVSLQIQKAERLVLFGPSGSGKTTVLRLIAGLKLRQAKLIEDRIVAGPGRNVVPPKRDVECLSRSRALASCNGAANLMFGLDARRFQSARPIFASAMLQRGLEHRMDSRPHQLSGGEQQRVALARALVTHPSILLMDEPLSSLDDERKQAIASDLLGLHNQLGFTLLYVTHDQAETDLLASRVCRMHGVQPADLTFGAK
jgi:ABC-type Fe3+/spermidine/putrescine transport system ATPase subunit